MKLKPEMIAAGLIAGLAALMIFSDKTVKTQSGANILRNVNEYQSSINKAAELATTVFQKADAGQELSEQDKSNLELAAKEFEAMKAYDPKSVTAVFGAGKCYMILGDKQRASENLEQAYLNYQIDPSKELDGVKDTAIEAAGLLSEVVFTQGNDSIADYNSASQSGDKTTAQTKQKEAQIYYKKSFDYANIAVQQKPNGFRYLLARCQVLLATGNKDQALKDFQTAKSLAPTDYKVVMFGKLLGN